MTHLPDHELNAFLMTVTDAVDLAHEGQVLDGYRCLLAGQERAQELAEDGEFPWASELLERYRKALLNYGEEWGIGKAL